MNWKRICRMLLCLLVVCCIVINVSPIRAQALGVTVAAVVGTVAVGLFVAASFQALGVMAGEDVSVFNTQVDACSQYLIDSGLALDGLITMLSVPANAASGTPKRTYAAEDAIQAVLDWLFLTAVVQTSTVAVGEGMWSYNGYEAKPFPEGVDLSAYPYAMLGVLGADSVVSLYFASQPLLINGTYNNYHRYYSLSAESGVNVLRYVVDNTSEEGWEFVSETSFSAGERAVSLALLESVGNTVLWTNYDIHGTEDYNEGALVFSGTEPIIENYK